MAGDRAYCQGAPSYTLGTGRFGMAPLGKGLILLGLLLVFAGAVIWGFGRVPYLGRLPGDIYVRRGNASFYFPLTTCILLSIAATIVLSMLRR